MSDMIDGLLHYSRVGTRAEGFGTVDLTRVVKEVESDLEIHIERTGARIEVGRRPAIEADSNQMRQLFQNLMSNSLKFHGEEKPVIKIYTGPGIDEPAQSRGTKTHRIFVEDNGIGFDEMHLERIFTLFQRLHGRSAFEGTGMGLAICRKIVERHQGSITATSKPGEGATRDIIDWSIPCQSIFGRKKPLAEAALRRISNGIKRYVLEDPKPFIVMPSHSSNPSFQGQDIGSPLGTITSKPSHALVVPYFVPRHG